MTMADDPPDEPRMLEAAIGAQIREMRQSLDMGLAELARSAEISAGMLSKIETGQTSPSLATLQKLALALNIPLASFFAKFDQKSDATFVRAGQGLPIERRGSRKGHLYQLLGHGLRSEIAMEPFLITLDENADAYPIFQHPGLEFLYVLEGEMRYRHGAQVYPLGPGDSLFFNAEVLHGPLELKRLPVVFLAVIASPAG